MIKKTFKIINFNLNYKIRQSKNLNIALFKTQKIIKNKN